MEKIKSYIKDNWKYLLFSLIITFISLISFKRTVLFSNFNNTHKLYFIAYVLNILFFVLMYMLIKYLTKKNVKIEKQFLIFGLLFGSLYMISTPPNLVPDEFNHFLRSYEISSGKLISTREGNKAGNYLDSNLGKVRLDVYKAKYYEYKDVVGIKESGNNTFYDFANTSLYSFICYMPSSIGILFGRILHLPIIALEYLGRIFNFVIWLLVIYFAIKYIPFGKRIIFMIAFMPMQLQEAISMAPDCLINSISLGLLAFILHQIYDKKKFTKKDYAIALLLTTLVSLLKIVYLPLCLLLLLIPKKQFKNVSTKYLKIGSIALFVIAINLIWLKISSQFLIEFNPGVDSALQLKGIIFNPFRFLVVLYNTYDHNGILFLTMMLGSHLGWLNVSVSQNILILYFVVMILVAINEDNKKLDMISKLLFGFIMLSVILLISISLYIQWTPVGATEIGGIQGRYYIPILSLGLFLLTRNNSKSKIKDYDSYILMIIAFVNFVALSSIFLLRIV